MSETHEKRSLMHRLRKKVTRAFIRRFEKIYFSLESGQDRAKTIRLFIAVILTFAAAVYYLGPLILGESSLISGVRVPGQGLLSRLFSGIDSGSDYHGGNLMISNFEAADSLGMWEFDSAKVELSKEFSSDGNQSMKVGFAGKGISSGIAIEDFFSNHKKFADWSHFDAFQFHVFNTAPNDERVIFQVKDQWDRLYKEDIVIPPGQDVTVIIPISSLVSSVNVRKIEQMTIFRWEPSEGVQMFFDDFELTRADQSASAKPGEKASGKNRPVKRLDYGFNFRKSAWLAHDPRTKSDVVSIPFVVVNENDAPCLLCPAEGGIPIPMGELRNVNDLRLHNAMGEEIPVQARVLSRWTDGSVKWAGLEFLATLAPHQGAGFVLDYGFNVHPHPFQSAMKVEDTPEKIVVTTGPLAAEFSKQAFYLFQKVSVDLNANGQFDPDEALINQAPLTLKFHGEEYAADRDRESYKISVEENGPQRVVIKASGWFVSQKGKRYCQAVLRYYFYQGKTDVKVSHTLIYTGYPSNIYYEDYKKFRLPENETLSSYGMNLPVNFPDPKASKIMVGRGYPEMLEANAQKTARLMQLGWEHARFVTDSGKVPQGEYYSSWMDISDAGRGVTAAIRRFRENFPKAIAADKTTGTLSIDLWPEEAGDMDLSTTADALGPEDYARGNAFGLAKTHEILFYFHGGDGANAHAMEKAYSFSNRLLIRSNPYWVDATGALGRLFPVDQRYSSEEKLLERIFDWAERQPRLFGWYGMLNFGDTLTWYRSEDETKSYPQAGWNPVGRWGWYNCEGVGTHTGALLQFVRSAEWRYFEFGENLARHIMDVDTIHYDTISADPRLKKLDPLMSQVGSMHRHSANHWSGRSDEASHTSVVGLLIYYHLTGDERAWDVINEVGEYFLKEPFTYVGHKDIAPHRAMANALWGDSLLFEATGDMRYKRAADKIIDIYLAGQQPDGSFLENYNPQKKTWSGEKHYLYMEGYALGAFMAYHELTQDEEVKNMFLKTLQFLLPAEYSPGNILHALGYAYLINGDPQYLKKAEETLKYLKRNQITSRDPIFDGLIYEKPIYHRPMVFLSTVPYIFGALEAGFAQERRH